MKKIILKKCLGCYTTDGPRVLGEQSANDPHGPPQKLGVDQDVVNKDHNKLIQIGLEYHMHEIHECRWHIHQPERHHCETEMPIPHPKRCLRDISLPNSQLMITGAKVIGMNHACISVEFSMFFIAKMHDSQSFSLILC